MELDFCEAFGVKVLSGELLEDFDTLISVKNSAFFAFDDEDYLLQFCALCDKIAEFKEAKITYNSLFYSQIQLENDKIFKLKLCFAYAQIFANFANFMALKGKKNILNEKKLNFYQVFFVDNTNTIKDFGKTSRAFITVQDRRHFAFLSEALANVRGFVIADRENLFCDFAYRELAELKGFTSFRYCLVQADENEFEATFSEEKNEKSLFDIASGLDELNLS